MRKPFILFFFIFIVFSSFIFSAEHLEGKWVNSKDSNLILKVKEKREYVFGYLSLKNEDCMSCADYSNLKINPKIVYFKFKKRNNGSMIKNGILLDPFDKKKYRAKIKIFKNQLIITQKIFLKSKTTKWIKIYEK